MDENREIDFKGRVLDNVHGFIYYTAAEEQIMNTSLFKRLQSIKQLSIVNWVFPGSEHTRYIHSLGVMYIADKIALQLKLSNKERRIVRFAGLLHDIGHYPLSHVCEYPYKESLQDFPDSDYCKSINKNVKNEIDNLKDKSNHVYMRKSNGCHHEQIGADIILHNEEINKIIIEECGDRNAVEIISDMVIGNVERTNPLLVQILHSELDADGIDYLMRDAMFSGTSFGAFELDQLIGCMCRGKYEDKEILCISPKGIAAADQYLINKFFSYSQVVFNKHIGITEWMAEQIVNWMQRNSAYFPRSSKLKKWVTNAVTDSHYIDFTDNYFWASLQNLISNPLSETEPVFIKYFCEQLLHHSELQYEDNSEVKIVSTDMETIKKEIQESNYYKRLENWTDRIGILNIRSISKQTKQKEFDEILQKKVDEDNKRPNDLDIVTEDDNSMLQARRLMECICVKEDNDLHLLCDDKRSMMQTMYNLKLVIFRTYQCRPE